jgi:hypothetical protein
MLFQSSPYYPAANLADQSMAEKSRRPLRPMQATARYPRLIRDVYVRQPGQRWQRRERCSGSMPRRVSFEAVEWPNA